MTLNIKNHGSRYVLALKTVKICTGFHGRARASLSRYIEVLSLWKIMKLLLTLLEAMPHAKLLLLIIIITETTRSHNFKYSDVRFDRITHLRIGLATQNYKYAS